MPPQGEGHIGLWGGLAKAESRAWVSTQVSCAVAQGQDHESVARAIDCAALLAHPRKATKARQDSVMAQDEGPLNSSAWHEVSDRLDVFSASGV